MRSMLISDTEPVADPFRPIAVSSQECHRSVIDTTPAVQELLICTHGGVVITQFTSHQLKAFAEFMMELLVVVSNHIQPTALQRSVRAEGGHEHEAAWLD